MRAVQVKITAWEKPELHDPAGFKIGLGDKIVIKTDIAMDMGEAVGFVDVEEKTKEVKKDQEAADENVEPAIKQVIRKATLADIEKTPSLSEKKEALNFCKEIKNKHGLAMKFIDAHFSFDGSRIIFAFIADGRVDFREMVKDLTRHFGRTIRLQQIGIRDEAKVMGDVGHCGNKLCCKTHLKELLSITSDMAELQQCSHRGSDRISGVCGRLFCCLAYEQEGYKELLKNLPEIGVKVNVDGKHGEIVGRNILKQTVNVKFKGENGESTMIQEIDINRNKKKNKD